MNREMMRPALSMAYVLFLAFGFMLLSTAAGWGQAGSGGKPPLTLAAEDINLEERFSESYSGEDFSITPAGAVREWVKNRLRADGTPGVVKVILLDAKMTRTDLKTKGGVRGWFTDDQKYRYDGRIHIRIEHQPVITGQSPSNAEAEASGYFTMPEDATVNQLEKKTQALVRDLMLRTSMEIENNMLRHMPGVVR